MSNYYKQLGIPLDADSEEIELAYEAVRQLIDSQDELHTVDIAYQTLSDPVLRLRYDQTLLEEVQQTNLVLPNVQKQVAKAQKQMAKYKQLYGQLMEEHRQRVRLSSIVSVLSGVVVLLLMVLLTPPQLWLTGVLLWVGEIASAFFLLSFLGLFNQERALRNLLNLSWRWGLYFCLLSYTVTAPQLERIESDFLFEWLPLIVLTVIPHFLISLEVIRSNLSQQHQLDKKQFFKIHGQQIERATVWLEYDNSLNKSHWRSYEDDSLHRWTKEDTLGFVVLASFAIFGVLLLFIASINNIGFLAFLFFTVLVNVADRKNSSNR